MLLVTTFLLFPFLIYPQQPLTPSGQDILKAIDANLSAGTRVLNSKMIVHGRRSKRTIASVSWIKGTERAFTEYTAPPREKGTKMLKLGNQLWTYSPQTDRTIQISGHMLRQSLMGSDLSYEDMMQDQSLWDDYLADVISSETVNDRDCWVLLLTAKKDGLAYHSRKLWVDKERLIPIREELFAKSGRIIKSAHIEEVMRKDGRWFPRVWVFKDELKAGGKGTEWVIEDIQFDVEIPDSKFSKAQLRK